MDGLCRRADVQAGGHQDIKFADWDLGIEIVCFRSRSGLRSQEVIICLIVSPSQTTRTASSNSPRQRYGPYGFYCLTCSLVLVMGIEHRG
jgi:hypothetical protein